MKTSSEISAADAVRAILRAPAALRCVDVRSEGEFADGAISGFTNMPILRNEERHQVGLCYKEKGPSTAIELGHKLVSPHRDQLIESWKSELAGAELPLVTCWRGGMRSQLASDWINESGGRAVKVVGGYKALRHELLAPLEHLPELCVISGPTGSNKSGLLRNFQHNIDLEKLANHRGSAFGHNLSSPQPSQANFENALGLALLRQKSKQLLVEDESLMIGQIHLPPPLRIKMSGSPVVIVRMTAEERARNILQEYIEEPIKAGISSETLLTAYQHSIQRIAKKLGGLLTQQTLGKMQIAFASGKAEHHLGWIQDLLVHYYDNAYAYSFARANRAVAFEGDWNECKQWIQNKFA